MKRRNFLGYLLLFIAGCTTTTQSSNNSTINIPSALRFAVTDAKGINELERDYESFRLLLEEILATKVEFFPVDSYFAAAAAALQSNQVDLVWAGPSKYLVIRSRSNAIPIIQIFRPEYYTIFVVNKDSGIKSLADLKGKNIDMRTQGSTISHLSPSKILADAEIDPQKEIKPIFPEDHNLEKLINKEVDAWVSSPFRYKQEIEKAGLSEDDYPNYC